MPAEKEADRMCSVNDPAHDYELHNVGEGVQNIKFIKKESQDGELVLVHDGTTNEAVLQVLIHRMKCLQERLPDAFTAMAISHCESALVELEKRTADRKERGVEGTSKE